MDEEKKKMIVDKAMKEAGKVFGVDPAYYGDEGDREVEKQIRKLGYDPEELKKKE